LRIDCAVFEAGDAVAQATMWQRFATERSATNANVTLNTAAISEDTSAEDDEAANESRNARDSEESSHEVTAVAAAGHDPEL
jgi:hypothetical protein